MLPDWAFEGETYERKLREIIQSAKLTEAYPGEEGKKTIITAYLNNSFYGNNTYGVQAAAYGYFGKPIGELTLAQYAILAGIPQSPTSFNLMKNAEQVCLDPEANEDDCEEFELVVPPENEIVVRRNHILELMKANSPRSADRHTALEYEQAKQERVAHAARRRHLARRALRVAGPPRAGRVSLPRLARRLRADRHGRLQGHHDARLEDAAQDREVGLHRGRAPNAKSVAATRAFLKRQKIPANDYSWILALRGKRIHNAASAVMDYRTGQILAYAGSASYTAKGSKRFQPQFDVLADGWRQPGRRSSRSTTRSALTTRPSLRRRCSWTS